MRRAVRSLARRLLGSVGLVLVRRSNLVRSTEEASRALEHALTRAEGFSFPTNPHRSVLMSDLQGTSLSEALHLIHHLHQALVVPGDVCEFGVAQGATSAVLANELVGSERQLWLYDSFQGLPDPTDEDRLIDDVFSLGSMAAYAGRMSNPASEVRRRLGALPEPFEDVQVVKGFFENVPGVPGPVCVSFAYVDFDLYRPILDALRYLHDRLSVHGRVVVDDYRYFSAGAERAVHEFLDEHGEAYSFHVPNESYGRFCVLVRTQ